MKIIGSWLPSRKQAPQPEASLRSRTPIVVTSISVAIGAFFFAPALVKLIGAGKEWLTLRLSHGEATSLSTYGKWWIHKPHRFLVDGLSGDFPTFYNYLGDAATNLLSLLIQLPPALTQAALLGPLLAALFFGLNFLSLRALDFDRKAALGASLFISLGADSRLGLLVLSASDQRHLETFMHVPFHAIALANAQSFGWILLLPTLALLFRAYQRFSVGRAVCAGLAVGALFQTHTLTFLHVAFAHVTYLLACPIVERIRRPEHSFLQKATGLALSAAIPFWLISQGQVTTFHIGVALVALHALAFVLNQNKAFFLVTYPIAALFSLPYLSALRRATELAPEGSNPVSIPLLSGLIYFAIPLLFGWVSVLRERSGPSRFWLFSFLGATLFLSSNHLWGWSNHPYRFTVHLIFAFGPLLALSLSEAWSTPRLRRLVFYPTCIWLGLVVLSDAVEYLGGHRRFVHYDVGGAGETNFLSEIERSTNGDSRLLLPPEFHYPRALVSDSLAMGWSHDRSFLPDYRYIQSRERYLDRLALFCFLFPGYPHWEIHSGLRACEASEAPPASEIAGSAFLEPKLRNSMLRHYGIRHFAWLSAPPGWDFHSKARAYGWIPLGAALGRDDESRGFYRIPNERRLAEEPEDLELSAPQIRDRAIELEARVRESGNYRMILGGRLLSSRIANPRLDSRPITPIYSSRDWILFEVRLSAGDHRITLPNMDPDADPSDFQELLYFAHGVGLGR